jgi:hypothetical protein
VPDGWVGRCSCKSAARKAKQVHGLKVNMLLPTKAVPMLYVPNKFRGLEAVASTHPDPAVGFKSPPASQSGIATAILAAIAAPTLFRAALTACCPSAALWRAVGFIAW